MPPQGDNKKNHIAEREERRCKVASLYVQGRTQHQIARELKVSQPCVSGDLAMLRDQWRQSALRDFSARQAEELARIDHLERVAWEAWQRSNEDAVTTITETEDGVEWSKATRKGQYGDSAFLDKVGWCIETRLKLMGLLKGPQVQVNQTNLLNWDVLASSIPDGPIPDLVQQTVDAALGYRPTGEVIDVTPGESEHGGQDEDKH